jgi:hypothetical protein
MQLPFFQTSITELSLMQSKWKSILNPVVNLPLNNTPSLLQGVVLKSGDNVINHKLGRTPQGYIIVDNNAAVQVYRSAAFNDLTLTLHSNGAAVISLLVF